METPDALAGATGADQDYTYKTEHYRTRAIAATALGCAIANCHPEDACALMEAALDDLRAGMPRAPFLSSIMAEATFWAGWATRNEAKAYALAAYSRLSAADQSAFLAHVGGRMQ